MEGGDGETDRSGCLESEGTGLRVQKRRRRSQNVFGRSSFTSAKSSHGINTSSFRVAVVKNRTRAKTSSGSRSSRLEPPPPPPERCCCRLRELIPSPGAYDVGCAGLSPSAPTSFWQRFPCESSLKDTESGFGEGRSGRYTRHGD